MDDPRNRPAPDADDRKGVEGGERDVSTDVQPPAAGASHTGEDMVDGGRREERGGGMMGEG